MRDEVTLTPGETAAGVVCNAIFHARGHCAREDHARLMNDVFDELVDRGVLYARDCGDYIVGTIQRRPDEPLDGAVFRHVFRLTGDARLAEQSVGHLAKALKVRHLRRV